MPKDPSTAFGYISAWIPRDHWLDQWEKQAILDYELLYPLEGYRRLTFMMLDADIVAVSPSSVYRTLKAAGRIGPFNGKPSSKGTGFQHPLKAHEHWHIDVSYLNIHGTFYYLASILDGYSRSIIHFEIHESMTESQIEIILQRAPRLPCLWTTPGGSSSNTSFTTTPSASTAPSAM